MLPVDPVVRPRTVQVDRGVETELADTSGERLVLHLERRLDRVGAGPAIVQRARLAVPGRHEQPDAAKSRQQVVRVVLLPGVGIDLGVTPQRPGSSPRDIEVQSLHRIDPRLSELDDRTLFLRVASGSSRTTTRCWPYLQSWPPSYGHKPSWSPWKGSDMIRSAQPARCCLSFRGYRVESCLAGRTSSGSHTAGGHRR